MTVGKAPPAAAPPAQRLLEPDVISSENGPGTPFQQRFDYIGTRASTTTRDLYEGQFEAGRFNGDGVYRWADGAVYVGQFRGGQLRGSGVHSFASGARYVGQFADDLRHGAGTYTAPSGHRASGRFEFGHFVHGTYTAAPVTAPSED